MLCVICEHLITTSSGEYVRFMKKFRKYTPGFQSSNNSIPAVHASLRLFIRTAQWTEFRLTSLTLHFDKNAVNV